MNLSTGAIFIIIVCVLVLLMGAFKTKMEWIINFVLRCVAGSAGIYFINIFLNNRAIGAEVGLNVFSVLTSGFLGFPGLILLYGINFYNFL